MQHTSSNSRPSRRSKKTPITRFLEVFVDACACSPNPGYIVDDDLDDLSYYEQNARTSPEFVAAPSKQNNLNSYDASTLYRDADKSMEYLINYRNIYRSRQESQDHQKDWLIASPASDATATTVLTGSSSRDSEATICRRGDSVPSPPKRSSIINKERAHSIGTMPHPEKGSRNEHYDQEIIDGSNSFRTNAPRDLSLPGDCCVKHPEQRIRSEILHKIPFRTVQNY